MTGWVEVADQVFHRRYDPWDVSVCVVRGSAGLLVVDTRSSHREADELLQDLSRLGGPVCGVVNTHAHFDHVFGNARFGPGSATDAPLYGHRNLPAHLQTYELPMLRGWLADPSTAPVTFLDEVVVTAPTVLVDERMAVELGSRRADLLHLGPGHTDHDLIVSVPDAGAWLVGDLLEESGPPAYGTGSFPLHWPGTVQRLLREVAADDVLVPGHGAPVDRGFAEHQQLELEQVATTIRTLHAERVPVGEAVHAGRDRWPFPVATVSEAVADGYQQLDRHPDRR